MKICSVIPKYLCNKNKHEAKLNGLMGTIFQTPPKISFFCECGYYRRVRINGKVSHRRVVKHRETYEILYYSAKDVIGLFFNKLWKEKRYIKLELDEEINFVDFIENIKN